MITTMLEEQLRLSFDGPAWHGPSVEEALRGVTPELAATHPIPNAHSIWELVLHLAGAYGLVLRRLGGDTSKMSQEEDWPPVPAPTKANWERSCDELRSLNRRAREAIATFPVERLDQPLIADPPYSAFTQFIGLTQHDLYHAGQIVLLKRVAAQNAGA